MNSKKYLVAVTCSMVVLSGQALSAEFAPASVRALGMGGSSVASTHGVDASYWNPAAYGFFGREGAVSDNNRLAEKDFGLDVDAGLAAYTFGPLDANRIKIEALPDPSTLTGQLNATQIQQAAQVVSGLSTLDTSPMGANLSVNGTVGARVANYGLGIRAAVDLNSSITIDATNVGFGNVFTSFTNGVVLPTLPTTTYFNAQQVNEMISALTTNAGLTVGEANAVVAAYDQALAGTAAGQEQQNTDAMIVIAQAAGTDLANNTTALSLRGVAIAEVGFTYGYAFSDNLSVGGVLKYMQADIVAWDTKLFSQNTSISFDRNNTERSTAFGLDVGVMYRIPSWQVGLTVKNINAPSFEHSGAGTFSNTPYVYELKPQVKFGAAWMPMDTLSVELGYDLTENEGATAESKTQYWNFGLEWDAWKVLAIRVGAFNNMSQDIGIVPTAGLGLNLWAARVDLAVAMSSSEVVLDGSKVPAYLAGALAVAVDF